ncbi:hypothetical protein [Marinobacter sp. SS21]|uniref:hypothetical protein n=1 Tax=Marinobacter sp. SS21 TaxID=2979460 RepID=UPI00232DA140|nr:hypothetical protein [Marinobacter sp. SS21]MDC0664118.1 hypothetical protein [Marinobacter sp. SS21]
MNLRDARDRAVQVVRNLPYLPGVLSPLNRAAPWSELEPDNYETYHHFVYAAYSALLPIYAPFRQSPHLPYEVPERLVQIDDNQAWFFLNGICTSRSALRVNGRALATLFNRRINLMHNPSDGALLDLLECALGRKMQFVSSLESSVASILEEALQTRDKVVLIVHSQGGIISTNALYLLRERLGTERQSLLTKLELYSFASAATELTMPEIRAEHFYHTEDYVARIGVGGYPERFSGRLFPASGSGHLLNTHYLVSFVNGDFEPAAGPPSQLWRYLRKRKLPARAEQVGV